MSSKINLTPSEFESRRLRKSLEQIVLDGITEKRSFFYDGSKFSVILHGRGVFCPRPNCIDQQFIDAINHRVVSLSSLVDEINELRSLWHPTVQKTCLSSSSLLSDEIKGLTAFSVSEEKINQMLHFMFPVVATVCEGYFLCADFKRRTH